MRVRLYTSRRRRKRARTRQWILLAGSVCVLFLCVLGLARYCLDAVRSDRIGQTFQEIYYENEDLQTERDSPALRGPILRQFEVTFSSAAAENATAAAPPKISGWPGNPSMTVSARLQKLQRQNKDIIGWLSIPDMLEQAVVQRNNTYYLNRDSLGYHNANGALFLEEGISLTSRPDTYIIFGHNMKTGEMFGSLRLYTDVGYYRRHPVIDFSVLYEEGRYVVFSIADVDIVQGMRRYTPFMQLPGMEAEQRAACIQQLQAFSHFYSPIQVNAEDQLLLLVTCEGAEESRRVLAARRMRDGESVEELQAWLQNARTK